MKGDYRSIVYLLGKCLAFPLEQTMASLSSLELGLHDTERLPSREDGLTILLDSWIYQIGRGRRKKNSNGHELERTAAPDMFARLIRNLYKLLGWSLSLSYGCHSVCFDTKLRTCR